MVDVFSKEGIKSHYKVLPLTRKGQIFIDIERAGHNPALLPIVYFY